MTYYPLVLNSQRVDDVGLRGECWECGMKYYIQMDASILRYMMYCIMLLVLVDRSHTTSGMTYYPLVLNSHHVHDALHRGSAGCRERVTYIMWCTYTSGVLSRWDKVRCLGIRWLPTLVGVYEVDD